MVHGILYINSDTVSLTAELEKSQEQMSLFQDCESAASPKFDGQCAAKYQKETK